MIAELPEPVLPHLCSFFTIKVNEVMAQVSKKWKRVADIYGCFGIAPLFLSRSLYSFFSLCSSY